MLKPATRMLKPAPTTLGWSVLEAASSEAKQIYFSLQNDIPDQLALARSHFYLTRQLEAASKFHSDIPRDLEILPLWIEDQTRQVGLQYAQYLQGRKAGGARHYFTSKSHALYFLKSVAPTKLVDGAWLYGFLAHWRDPCFSTLIRIYLEELGEGRPEKNHVLIFKKLLAAHGCNPWERLRDAHYVQGAIQLSLAHHAPHFLPEAIGFNLGYEQLPLHLLISAYELNELGIDPYYFTLHITVDNAASGHAKKALQGLVETLPLLDRKTFFQRVATGYKLNLLGISTNAIIDDFDLREELLAIFAAKGVIGTKMHSDYCRIAGKSVNQWLSDPTQLPAFLESLERGGWIKRHQDPERSRFWRLLEGEHAEMFGVFDAYERQVIYDWIAGDSALAAPREPTHRARRRKLKLHQLSQVLRPRQHDDELNLKVRNHPSRSGEDASEDDLDADLRLLEERLGVPLNNGNTMRHLTRLMSPTHHHTASGLMATRIFAALFDVA